MGDPAHWDDRYRSIAPKDLSWYEEHPTVSLELLDRLGVRPGDSVVDVGGGASRLVDHLLEAGHTDVAVLDLSTVALEAARARLHDPPGVAWLVHDVLTWSPNRRWDAWHDRAVLHFLTDDDERATYVGVMRRALALGGAFVIGTFAEDGPSECSALPVRRNRPDELEALLGDVDVIEHRRDLHRTPAGATQPFNWIAGRLRTNGS